MRTRRALLVTSLFLTSLIVAVSACGGDDTASTDATVPTVPTTTVTVPGTTLPATTVPSTTVPDTTVPTTTVPETTVPDTTVPETSVPETTTTEPEQPALVDVRAYQLRGERFAIEHHDVAGPAVLRGAIEALLAGPVDDSLATAIPAGTRLLDLNLADGTATVDLSREFESGGGSMSMLARIGQVVFTATRFDNVDEVVFWLDGAPIDHLGGEGIVMDEPWTRADVPREFTGGVLVDSPVPGASVSSPFVVTGEADVFEAQFPIEIRRDGETIATIAPVTGGAWGTWADFTVTITLDAGPGPIDLVAYDEGGCGDAPECPPVIETVVPLILM